MTSIADYHRAQLRAMSEAEFQRDVVKLARDLGWHHHHERFSIGSPSGLPDLLLWRPGDRLLFAELKRVGREPTARQAAVIESLRAAGQETYVWTPLDFDEIHAVLVRRRA